MKAEYVASVLADSPTVLWECQEGSGNPQDSSGNGNHATATAGAPEYQVAGPMPDAYGIRLNGGEYFTRAPILTSTTDNFTLELLQEVEIVNSADIIWHNGNSGANGWGIAAGNGANKNYGLAGGVAVLPNFANTFSLNTWHHIVVLRRAGTWEYYYDGAVDTANAGGSTPNVPTAQLSLGPVNGQLQPVVAFTAIYPTALSAARILAHYQAITQGTTNLAPVILGRGAA